MQLSRKFSFLNMLCNKMCDEQYIRFCGIIDPLGNLIAGSFKDGIHPLDNYAQRKMMYVQSRLELLMKAEYDNTLGGIDYTTTQRENVTIIRIPLKNQQSHIFISAERNIDVKKTVDIALDLFVNHRRHDEITNLHVHA